jgi:TRAP-type C4-dicarboxylate transport system permease small subunit
LKDQWHLGIQIMALLFGIGFFTWLIIETVPWFEFAFNRNIKTETSRILLYPWMAAMPFSLTLTCLVLIARLFGIIDRFDPKDIKPKFSKISGKV